MFKIVRKKVLNCAVKQMDIYAPLIARKALPGQFVILRVNERGERIPLTIADYNKDKGTVTVVFQEVGKTTKLLGTLNEGDEITDFAGPLGKPTEIEGYKRVVAIGGGLGTAVIYPQVKRLSEIGARVDTIIGARNKELIIFEHEMKSKSSRLFITTDDGSNGNKGFVSDVLNKLLQIRNKYDLAIAIGPLIMMKVICNITKQYGIKTIVSMNPIMIDGTGMCGCCRVTVGGQIKFACVDGPDFDGHLVDFDEAMIRQSAYKDKEKQAMEHHECRLGEITHG